MFASEMQQFCTLLVAVVLLFSYGSKRSIVCRLKKTTFICNEFGHRLKGMDQHISGDDF